MQRRRTSGLWWWSVGALAGAVGTNLVTPVLAATALTASLRTLLGTARVEVAVDAVPPPALWLGRVDRLTVRAYDVQAGDLRLAQFSATFRGLRIDPGALYADRNLVIRSVQFGRAHGTVSQDALARALARRSEARVDALLLQPGRVLARGTVRVQGTDIAVEGGGRLVLNGHEALDLILDQATATAPGRAATLGGRLTLRVPSVLRVPALPLGLRLTGIEVDDGRLVLDAVAGPS